MKTLIALALATLMLAGCQNQQTNITNGKARIEEFARNAFPGYELVMASCASMDTNGDGYLRGTLVVRKGSEMRIWRVDVPESGDPFQIQKGSEVSLAANQPFDNRLNGN